MSRTLSILLVIAALAAGAPPCVPAASAQSPPAPPAPAPAPAAPSIPAPAPAPAPAAAAEDLLPNARRPLPRLLTGGQPSAEQLEALAAAGYRTIVDLRPQGEQGAPADEPERVEALGMRYVRIPIAGAGNLTEEAARALDEVLDREAAYPAAVHCASGNRVGALLAFRAARLEGADPEAALALGRDAGLTRLEPAVRELLGLPPATPAEP